MIIDNGQARASVIAEALSWVGTPYHHHGRIKGVGVDCAQLLIAVYSATGAVPQATEVPNHYPTDWHLHRSEEMFRSWLAHVGAVQRDPDARCPGDIALFQFGRCFSHGGIFLEPETILHSYHKTGVVTHRLDEFPLTGRVMEVWNPWG